MTVFEFMFYVIAPVSILLGFTLDFFIGYLAGSGRKILGYGFELYNIYFNPPKQMLRTIIPLIVLSVLPYQYLEVADAFGYIPLLGYNILIFGAWLAFFMIGIMPFFYKTGLTLGYVTGQTLRTSS